MRLDKFLIYTLDISRTEAKKLIKNKEISINGKIVYSSNILITEEDVIIYNNQRLIYEQYVYLMMNKPSGYISSTQDREKTVLDLVDKYKKYNLFIVGRLDKDSEGLLILTNDGQLSHKLTNPKSNIKKKYYVEVDGKFMEEDILRFKEGVNIKLPNNDLHRTLPSELEIIDTNKAYIEIVEGKFHQIKLMCEEIGKSVRYLKRISIGSLVLDDKLQLGQYRHLNKEEIQELITW